jgi:hypothetical protein
LIGRTIDGRYRIDALVASGGMGRIYRAEQLGLGRTVAVKVLSVDPARQVHDPQFRERFALEAATASRLTSPHTITIFDYGRTDDDIYYIVMEYVEGTTLGHLLRREGRLDYTRAITIVGQICLSLREAHARGIVHRDIKPSNVMLIDGDYDQIKVLDFGIAKQMVRETDAFEELTSSSSYIGTPEYMAPENLDSRIDSRSDIYAVGVVLYLTVTGRLPFKGKTATQTIIMALREQVPPIDPALGLPTELEEIIYACLEKDPERRPASVDDVLRALQSCPIEEMPGDSVPAFDIDMEPSGEAAVAAPPRAPIARQTGVQSAPVARPRRAARVILAGLGLFAVGASGGLILRFALGRDAAPPSVAPAAAPLVAPLADPAATEAALPARAIPPPEVTPYPTAAPDGGSAADPAAASADESEPGESSRARPRRARARSERPPREAPARGARTAPPDKQAKPDVPAGYKDSPY